MPFCQYYAWRTEGQVYYSLGKIKEKDRKMNWGWVSPLSERVQELQQADRLLHDLHALDHRPYTGRAIGTDKDDAAGGELGAHRTHRIPPETIGKIIVDKEDIRGNVMDHLQSFPQGIGNKYFIFHLRQEGFHKMTKIFLVIDDQHFARSHPLDKKTLYIINYVEGSKKYGATAVDVCTHPRVMRAG